MDSIWSSCCFQETGSPGNSDNDDEQQAKWSHITMALEEGKINQNLI